MGGGASSSMMLEEGGGAADDILATTYLIGRTIAAIAFPGMFRIYDFHSPRAPKIRHSVQHLLFFSGDSDSEDGDRPPQPSDYEHLFHVRVGDDTIYLDDPLEANELGWTPLHTCCMSFLTVPAAEALVREHVRKGRDFETKTKAGPGTFNRGWTALHMACAYGVEPVVDLLVSEGANVNTINSFGVTPMLEACHRGYMNICLMLLKSGRVDLSYIPPMDLASKSPFVNSPPQSPLGEAARSGFQKIVQTLLDFNAPKDLQNSLGWTPLHEACFFNRVETVKTLLLAGARADIRTSSGALPYHLASLQLVRTMLREMGGDAACPGGPSDAVDMIQVLRELTCTPSNPDFSDPFGEELTDTDGVSERKPGSGSAGGHASRPDSKTSSDVEQDAKQIGNSVADVQREQQQRSLLHSGPLLGDLPALGSPSSHRPDAKPRGSSSKGKKGGKRSMPQVSPGKASIPPDCPPEFICELSQTVMSDPVRSIYGNVFEYSAINQWLKHHGRVCPVTGAPLNSTELQPDEKLREEIARWQQRDQAAEPQRQQMLVSTIDENAGPGTTAGVSNSDSDIYDF